MTSDRATAPLLGGIALMERAISYTRGSLCLVTPQDMRCPTPCQQWDVRALLAHMNDSLAALHEAIELGYVDLGATEDFGDPAADPVATLCNRSTRLLGAWAGAERDEMVSVGGCSVSTSIVASAGAIEVTVHGWDIARACGAERPIPPTLAAEMLELAPLLATDDDRPARFAAPLDVPPLAGPAERLLAFLGRREP